MHNILERAWDSKLFRFVFDCARLLSRMMHTWGPNVGEIQLQAWRNFPVHATVHVKSLEGRNGAERWLRRQQNGRNHIARGGGKQRTVDMPLVATQARQRGFLPN
mmetsp:Transcript_11609/g.35477  ORF Transcript_11609/g.35477 Transcript_11609/m.35477 type:complete len:105 (-) Transcript_11609:133-447(-)